MSNLRVIRGAKGVISTFKTYLDKDDKRGDKALEEHMNFIRESNVSVSSDVEGLIQSVFRQGYLKGAKDERESIVNLYKEDANSFKAVVLSVELAKPEPKLVDIEQ